MRLLSELRLAARTLRASSPFAAVSIAALALGLGANAMLFSVADAVLLRPFPFAHADRLVIAGENLLEPRSEITYRDFLAWRSGGSAFDDLAAIGSSNWSWRLRTPDEQVEVRYRAVSGHFFDVVGARALVGRALRGDDDRAEAARVVVLSHGFFEALWLSLGATIAAIVAAYALLPVVVAMLQADVPRIGEAALNGRAIAFACGIGILTAVLSAIAPAIRMARVDLEPVLRKGGHTAGAGLRHPFRRALIVAELAAAVVLIAAVGLLTRSVVQLRHLDIGFNPRGLVAIEMSMPAERMRDADARALLASAADALARLPGVASVSSVSQRPLQGPIGLDSPYEAEGQTAEQARQNPYVNTQTISASYFNTMQTPLVAGRAFDDGDRAETARVLIVSRRFAELVWPGQNALGRRLRVAALDRTEPPTRVWWTVVGVAGDIRYRALASPGITLYAPIAQSPDRASEFVLRTSAPLAIATGPIRSRLQAMNANGIVTIAPMQQMLRTLEAPWRANLGRARGADRAGDLPARGMIEFPAPLG
jgi:hypothetical protein